MSVIIFEGSVGAGKSTLARLVAEQTGRKVYRPFRSDGDGHSPGASLPWAQYIHLPINTWMEDMFQADLHEAWSRASNLLLDRSMPSAIAYEAMGLSNAPAWMRLDTEQKRTYALDAWSSRMTAAGAKIIYVYASARACQRRSENRVTTAHVEREQQEIKHAVLRTGLPFLMLSTTASRKGGAGAEKRQNLKAALDFMIGA